MAPNVVLVFAVSSSRSLSLAANFFLVTLDVRAIFLNDEMIL